MLIEVGTGPAGAYATVSAYADGEPADANVFTVGGTTMITVEDQP